MKISILLPTRGRSEQLNLFCDSLYDLANDPSNIEVIARIDDDDIDANEACELIHDKYPNIVWFSKKRKIDPGCMWNECYERCSGEIVMQAGDDAIFRTKDWDKFIIEEFNKVEDKILLVWCNDMWHRDRLAIHPFMSRQWVDTIGYVAPEGFPNGFHDDWITELAKNINRTKYLDNVIVEHMHQAYGKMSRDKTFYDAAVEANKVQVLNLYNQRKHERIESIDKLKLYIANFKK